MAAQTTFVGKFRDGSIDTELNMVMDDEVHYGERSLKTGKIWGKLHGEEFRADYRTTLELSQTPDFDLADFIYRIALRTQRWRTLSEVEGEEYFCTDYEMPNVREGSGL